WRERLEVSRTLHLPDCPEQQSHRAGAEQRGHVSLHRRQDRGQETRYVASGYIHRALSCARAAERLCQGSLLRTAPPEQTTAAGGGAKYPGAPSGSALVNVCGCSPRTARGDTGSGCAALSILRAADAVGSDAAAPAATQAAGGDDGYAIEPRPTTRGGRAQPFVSSVPGSLGAPGFWCAAHERSASPQTHLCLPIIGSSAGIDARSGFPAARSVNISGMKASWRQVQS